MPILKKSQINNSNFHFKKLGKKNKVRSFILPNFKTYCRTTVVNRVWFWHKGRHNNQ